MNNEIQMLELLQSIHLDLGALVSLIIFFVIVLLLYFAYKFFDMIFKF